MGNKSNTNFVIDYQDPRLLRAIEMWDVIDFLESYQVDYSLSGKNIGRNHIGIVPCPFCGDTKNHFAIHRERKMGSCFSCGQKAHSLKIISFYGRMSFKKAYEYLIDIAEFGMNCNDRIKEILHTPKKEYVIKDIQTDPLPKSRPITISDINSNKSLNNFFKERRLIMWHVHRYDLRLSLDPKYKSMIIFPLKIYGIIISYQMRSINHKRYHNAPHLNQYLFNEEKITSGRPLILVEGFLDMTRIDTFITHCYNNRIQVVTGALKSISTMQKNRLAKYQPNPLIIMWDRDSWQDYSKVKDNAPFNVDYIILPKGEDPCSLSWNQMVEVFKKDIDHYIK